MYLKNTHFSCENNCFWLEDNESDHTFLKVEHRLKNMGKKDNAIGGGPRGGRLSVGIKVEKRRKEKIKRERGGRGSVCVGVNVELKKI